MGEVVYQVKATNANYNDVIADGTLKVEPNTTEQVITVTGNSKLNAVYSGREQSVNGYTVSTYEKSISFSGIAQEDAKATAKGTDAGTYEMTMTAADFTATSNNYTNITINVVPGKLVIGKAAMTINYFEDTALIAEQAEKYKGV